MIRVTVSSAAALVTCAGGLLAGTSVAINVNTSSSTPIAPGFSGFNAPQLRNGVEYYDPKFVAAVSPLKPGWLRFPGGTASMAYDWNGVQAGHINTDWLNSLVGGTNPPVTGQAKNVLIAAQQLTQAKGGVWFADYSTFVQTLGANTGQTPNTIICFNAFTDNNPNSAYNMALQAQSYGLNVIEWELANEPYLFPALFPTFASYAQAMYPYFAGIVSASPAATVAVFLAGQFPGNTNNYSNWDTGLAAYTPQYWNSISTHAYPLTSQQTVSNSIQILNGVLAHGTNEYMNSYVNPLIGTSTPVFITELNCCAPPASKFLSYLYNGIFLVEYILRMSSVPNVKAVGINSLYTDNYDYHGIVQSVNDYEGYLVGSVMADSTFATDTATDPKTPFQFYMSAPGVALEVADQGINASSAIWPTTVKGGPMVKIQGYDGNPIPAVYAQAYQGTNGIHNLLITNKSSSTLTATVQVNGTKANATFRLTFVSSPGSAAANTAQSPNNVQIQTQPSANPISVGPFSVTLASW